MNPSEVEQVGGGGTKAWEEKTFCICIYTQGLNSHTRESVLFCNSENAPLTIFYNFESARLSAFIIISENHQFNPNQLTLQLGYYYDDDHDEATNQQKVFSGQDLGFLRISCLTVHTTFLPTISLLALSFATVNLNASLITSWLGSVLLVYYI